MYRCNVASALCLFLWADLKPAVVLDLANRLIASWRIFAAQTGIVRELPCFVQLCECILIHNWTPHRKCGSDMKKNVESEKADAEKRQVAAFRKAAQQLGCKPDEKRFQDALRTVAKAKPSEKNAKRPPSQSSE